jgi:hypothetical protein
MPALRLRLATRRKECCEAHGGGPPPLHKRGLQEAGEDEGPGAWCPGQDDASDAAAGAAASVRSASGLGMAMML